MSQVKAVFLVCSRRSDRRHRLATIAEEAGGTAQHWLGPVDPALSTCAGILAWGSAREIAAAVEGPVRRAWLVDRPTRADVNLAARTGILLVSPPEGLLMIPDFVRGIVRRLDPDASALRLGTTLALRPRPLQVFVLILRGLHRTAIMDALGIAGSTLDKHLGCIYRAAHEHSIAAVHAWGHAQLRKA